MSEKIKYATFTSPAIRLEKRLIRTSMAAQPIRLEKSDLVLSSGVFIRLPEKLAGQFPQKVEEDSSPPHLTMLYIGDLNRQDFDRVVEIVREAIEQVDPFDVHLDRFDSFKNHEGQQIPHMTTTQPVLLKRLHARIRMAVEDAGVEVEQTYGPDAGDNPDPEESFTVHATLGYVEEGDEYSGPKPAGTFTVSNLEVWGFGVAQVSLAPVELQEKRKKKTTKRVRRPYREAEKLTTERAKLREAEKDNPGERCSLCRYFEAPEGCRIVERAGPDLVCDWIQSREVEKALLYEVSDNDWIDFVRGMIDQQPYQHIVRDAAITPDGPLVLIEDTAKPRPHRFSLTKEFHISHSSLEHHWPQQEVDRLIEIGRSEEEETFQRGSLVIQTLILSKEEFNSLNAATAWVRAHDFKVMFQDKRPDETENSYRFRQRDPGTFEQGSFRTFRITDGVQATGGRLKRK